MNKKNDQLNVVNDVKNKRLS